MGRRRKLDKRGARPQLTRTAARCAEAFLQMESDRLTERTGESCWEIAKRRLNVS